MKTIFRDVVSALIFSKDSLLFMGMKDPKKGGVYADCWHIPGGGIEPSESPTQALARELQEEVGLSFPEDQVGLIDDQGAGESVKMVDGEQVLCKMKFFVYKIKLDLPAKDIQIQLNDDLVKFKWFAPNGLKDCKLTPPSQKLFEKIGLI